MKRIIPREITRNGEVRWQVCIPRSLNNGQQRRKYFREFSDAKKYCDTLEESMGSVTSRFHGLLPMEQARLLFCLDKVGGDLKVLESLVHSHVKIQDIMNRKEIAKTIPEFIESKRRAGKREAWVDSLEVAMNHFSKGREETLVSEVTVGEIEDYLHAHNWSARTVWNRWTELKTFFTWCCDRKYCLENPTSQMDTPEFESSAIRILSVDQVDNLMAKAQLLDPGLVPHLALMIFGGLRAQEVERLSHSDITPTGIRIRPEVSKTRRARFVSITPTLSAWINCLGEMPAKLFSARMLPIREAAGISRDHWQSSIMRHTFCSYSIPVIGLAQTALEAGHNETMLIHNYRAIATKEEAERFWSIRPKSLAQLLSILPPAPQPPLSATERPMPASTSEHSRSQQP